MLKFNNETFTRFLTKEELFKRYDGNTFSCQFNWQFKTLPNILYQYKHNGKKVHRNCGVLIRINYGEKYYLEYPKKKK